MEFKVGDTVRLVNEDKYLHPSELKDGDFIKIWNDDYSFIYIFKEYKNNNIYRYVCFDLEDKRLNRNPGYWKGSCDHYKITYATEEEKKLLNHALLKEGYIWNNVAKQLQTIDTITINDSIGVVDIPSAINPCYIPSHPKYGVFVDTDKKELDLFPTKKHYQLNFNY